MSEIEKKAENYARRTLSQDCCDMKLVTYTRTIKSYIAGATENSTQWHKVADGKLPELDKKVWVMIRVDDDTPMVARRHVYTSRGYTEWVWECYWGSGFDLEQDEIFAWCEIPQFKE